MSKLVIQTSWALLLAAMVAAAHADVTIIDPWVRGMVQGQSATGMFMTIRSTSATRLIGAASPVADHLEIHKMAMEKDVMTMQPVAGLAVPANGQVELNPGSYHVMLLGLKKPLVKGDKVPVILTFQDSDGKQTSTSVQAEVRALNDDRAGMKTDGMKMK